jgi:predicted secreted hydrolase
MRNLMLAMALCLAAWLGRASAANDAPAPQVRPGQALQFPRDFGAHPGFHTEWWYVTGWLSSPGHAALGYQITFFRAATGQGEGNPSRFAPQQLIIGHAALSDPQLGKLAHAQKTARQGFGLAYANVGDTDLKLDDWQLRRAADGSYHASVTTPEFTLDLQLRPSQPMLLQGDNGFSRKGPQPAQASYYYSEPQLQVSGSLSRQGVTSAVTGGGWLDHEWSQQLMDRSASGWDWVGANLADGSSLMAFQMRGATGGKLWAHAVLRDASGKITQYQPEQVQFLPRRTWRSPRSGAVYPVAAAIALQKNASSIILETVPLQDDQELDARRSTGVVYWEGAVTIMRDGKAIGRGYLEMTGYDKPLKL